ncbi:hypothetical protein F5146DRAFT_1077020 [Armillaria mellea]|nr:hypothetical protein F5146DRAFT_1077020 [Armillaria mellea]
MLLEEEKHDNWTRVLTFIRAGMTRWTTHYLSTRRFLELKQVLKSLVNRREDELRHAGGDKEEQLAMAAEVISIIDVGIAIPSEYKKVLEDLAQFSSS